MLSEGQVRGEVKLLKGEVLLKGKGTGKGKDGDVPEIPPGIVEGLVYNGKMSEHIEGAEITVLGTDKIFTTGDDGKYFFILVPAGDYTLQVKARNKTKNVPIKVTFDNPLTENVDMA